MPTIAIEGSMIMVAYSSVTETYVTADGTMNYKHIWTRFSYDLGETWVISTTYKVIIFSISMMNVFILFLLIKLMVQELSSLSIKLTTFQDYILTKTMTLLSTG